MIHITIELPSQIVGEHIRIATVIDETRLIPIEHTVDAQWEEFAIVGLLDDLLSLILVTWIIEIKEVG